MRKDVLRKLDPLPEFEPEILGQDTKSGVSEFIKFAEPRCKKKDVATVAVASLVALELYRQDSEYYSKLPEGKTLPKGKKRLPMVGGQTPRDFKAVVFLGGTPISMGDSMPEIYEFGEIAIPALYVILTDRLEETTIRDLGEKGLNLLGAFTEHKLNETAKHMTTPSAHVPAIP